MSVNDSVHHVVRTSAQWEERAIEFWVVPRGCLCVELTPDGKTKIKIGEGNKFYSQLPYITSEGDLSNYYTKTEIDNLLTNLNRMAIQSTEEYDSKNDLPMTGNKLGDVRFVKSVSPSIKTDPDVYVWDNTKWIYVGYDFSQIDLSEYVKKEEFEPVKQKVDEMYPLRHTHTNKEILDQVEVAFKVVDKNKLDSLENYDDTEVKNRLTNVESKAHVHNNMQILNMTTAAFTIPDKNKLDSLRNYDVFRGTNGIIPGSVGLVPAPQPVDVGKVLGADGRWVDVDVAPFTGASATTDGESGLVPAPLAGEQSYFLKGNGEWAKVKTGDKYKAGDGIYIMSSEVVIDSFPAEFYSRSNKLKNYIIYGNSGGVGEYDSTSNKYLIPIKITAEGETAVINNIALTAKLYTGDYIDYGNQTFVHTRTPVATPIVGRSKAIDSNGDVMSSSAYAVTRCCATDFIPVSSEFSYEVTPTYNPISSYLSPRFHALYDENQVCTRTIPANYNSTIQITPASNEKYMRLTGGTEYYGQVMVMPTVTQIGPVVETILIPSIGTYPNVVNTIDILTTVKPSSVFIEATPDEEDPDDPSSAFTGIIYNEGVLDVTQEDPNALNELTVHFRDDSKVLTLPETEPMTGATASTDGTGGTVPAPLTGQEEMFLRGDGTWANVPGSGEAEQYGAGAGINIIKGEASGDKFPINIASNDNYLEEYIIYGTEAGVGDYDSTTHKYVIPIAINAKDKETIRSYIYLDDPLGQGEYVVYSQQKAVKYRENILLSAGYEAGKFIADGGDIYSGDVDSQNVPISYLTGEIRLAYNERYILQGLTYDEHEDSQHVFCHWIRMNDLIGQTVTYSTSPMAVPSAIWGPSNSHRINVTVLGYEDNLYKARLYHMLGTATDIQATLARITIYAGVINTLDIETTNKPDQIYVRAHVNTDPDAPPIPETWIIENTGIIDVEQDETDRNKLTFKYKDTDKVITIPGGGSSYTPGNGIDITNDEISAKLGDGLSFDNNDAITVDEMVGATSQTAGTGGTVPAPLIGDENKFLCGDGTWQTVSGGAQYQAGQGIEIETNTVATYEDLHFDYFAFKDKIQGVLNGSISFDTSNHALTMTATNNYCYIHPYIESDGPLYKIPVEPNEDYLLTWEVNDTTIAGKVDVFENGDITVAHYDPAGRESAAKQQFLFTTSSTAETIHIRPYVYDAGTSLTFSNFQLYHVIYDTSGKIINAKLGTGLDFDSNDAIEVQPATTTTLGGVKVGAGLSMNANDELGVASPYVTSVRNQGSVPGVITVTKSDGISSDVDVLENLRLILNCNYDSTVTRSQLGDPVNAPQSGRTIGSPIMGDLTIIEVNE